jgi:hypothetical protein
LNSPSINIVLGHLKIVFMPLPRMKKVQYARGGGRKGEEGQY